MDYPIAFRYILLGEVEVYGAFHFCILIIQIIKEFLLETASWIS